MPFELLKAKKKNGNAKEHVVKKCQFCLDKKKNIRNILYPNNPKIIL